MVAPFAHTASHCSPTPQTTILKRIMTGGRGIRRVIGKTEVNFKSAGMEETGRLSRV